MQINLQAKFSKDSKLMFQVFRAFKNRNKMDCMYYKGARQKILAFLADADAKLI